jgi:hypothetical protein
MTADQVKERPILFSAPMVRAILDGTKTQTRRVVKQPERYEGGLHNCLHCCPYGQPGERLWVRETFGQPWHHAQPSYFYRATDDEKVGWHPDFNGWKPSIHMPRAASRILLEITEVRVERLRSITEADALAEGIVRLPDGGFGLPKGQHYHAADPRISYLSLWESIHGPGSVEADPWLWAVSFKRIKV